MISPNLKGKASWDECRSQVIDHVPDYTPSDRLEISCRSSLRFLLRKLVKGKEDSGCVRNLLN